MRPLSTIIIICFFIFKSSRVPLIEYENKIDCTKCKTCFHSPKNLKRTNKQQQRKIFDRIWTRNFENFTTFTHKQQSGRNLTERDWNDKCTRNGLLLGSYIALHHYIISHILTLESISSTLFLLYHSNIAYRPFRYCKLVARPWYPNVILFSNWFVLSIISFRLLICVRCTKNINFFQTNQKHKIMEIRWKERLRSI